MSTINTVGQQIDWPTFWQTYDPLAVWSLEWFDDPDWVTVVEGLTVQLSYPEPNRCKISLVFDAPDAGDYRITYNVDKPVLSYVYRADDCQIDLIYANNIQITFDWGDCAETPGLVFSYGVTGDLFWFRINQDGVAQFAHVEIDPSTVGTSTTFAALQFGFQRKGFYAAGLFWAWYSDGTDAGWETSADGVDWSGAFTSIGSSAQGYYFSVWFDGTYIHYARYLVISYDLFYRRGTPVNDGSINWSAAEQLVYDGSTGDNYQFPSISVDSNGYAWIGVYNDQPDGDDFPVVVKNANNDGTWAEDFAYELSAVDHPNWRVVPVPLTDGKVYVIYCRDGVIPLGRLYDVGWGVEENDVTDYAIRTFREFSAVAYGDNVHFVYLRVTTYQIRHNERVWGVGWDVNDVLVQDAVTDTCSPVLSVDPSANELYVFWTSTVTDHVYYKKYSGGAWDGAPTDWIDESTDDIKSDSYISSFYSDYGDYIGLLYVTKLVSPYNVKFAFLDLKPKGGGAVVMGTKSLIEILLLEDII